MLGIFRIPKGKIAVGLIILGSNSGSSIIVISCFMNDLRLLVRIVFEPFLRGCSTFREKQVLVRMTFTGDSYG